jgi:hypothetical protein
MAIDQQNDTSKFLLYAVNVLLQTINELPVTDDVELAEIQEAQLAVSVIVETKKEVLSEGWDFNRDDGYTFVQDNFGIINIPANVLDVGTSDGDIIMRDRKLYSRSEQSNKFDAPVDVSVIWDIDFNALSHPFQHYITVKAARKFLARQAMDTSVYGFTLDDEEDAYLKLRRSEGFTSRYNMFDEEFMTTNLVS